MKASDCSHLPKEVAGPRADSCEGGDSSKSLRYCLTCGHVGCCDSSPHQHARKHAVETGHETMASYPKSENSFRWCYKHDDYLE